MKKKVCVYHQRRQQFILFFSADVSSVIVLKFLKGDNIPKGPCPFSSNFQSEINRIRCCCCCFFLSIVLWISALNVLRYICKNVFRKAIKSLWEGYITAARAKYYMKKNGSLPPRLLFINFYSYHQYNGWHGHKYQVVV